MQEVYERVHVTSMLMGCPRGQCTPDWAVIHACKHPCHQDAVGYRGNLDKRHPNYLVLENDRDLYLNMIDPPVPLFPIDLFHAAMDFADQHWTAGRNVLFHCNQGRSRAPSLALVFAAKRRGIIRSETFAAARKDFEQRFLHYAPGRGIETFLRDSWDAL